MARETAPPSVYQRSPLHLQSSEAMRAVWHRCTYEFGSGVSQSTESWKEVWVN